MIEREHVAIGTSIKKGFTLLELLIVIGIIAVLSVVLILVLNPAETLKKSRDTQRLSDLSTLKTALGLYITSTTTPDLDGTGGMICLSGTATTATIAYSYPSSAVSCTANVIPGDDTSGDFSGTDFCYHVTNANVSKITGSGWVPVSLGALAGGSPISNLPVDPVNTIASGPTNPLIADLVYRYACQDGSPASGKPGNVFELNARLESAAYGPGGGDDKSANDGGDTAGLYEIGSSLYLMGSSSNY